MHSKFGRHGVTRTSGWFHGSRGTARYRAVQRSLCTHTRSHDTRASINLYQYHVSLWSKGVFEPPKRGFERGALWGTLRASAVVPSTSRPVYYQLVSRGQPSGLQAPTVPLKITNEIDFGPMWGPFNPYTDYVGTALE